jgi:uncharacterized protein (DUF1697 family)
VDRYVAFLRGMNLGGRRITNADLRLHFEALGCEEVATFRASGNVIFASEKESPAELTARLESGLAEALGYEVPVFLRLAKELQGIAAHQPFETKLIDASKGKLQVALLVKRPSAAAKKALAMSTDEDRLAIERRELYWLPSGGISESELDWKAIESIVGPTTIRTKGTIDQIAAKYFA